MLFLSTSLNCLLIIYVDTCSLLSPAPSTILLSPSTLLSPTTLRSLQLPIIILFTWSPIIPAYPSVGLTLHYGLQSLRHIVYSTHDPVATSSYWCSRVVFHCQLQSTHQHICIYISLWICFFCCFFTYIQNYNIRYLDYNVRALYSHIGVVKSTYIDYEAATHPTVYVHTVYGLYTHVIKLVELNILYVYPMAHGTLLIAVHIYLRMAYVVYYTIYNV